MNEELTFDYKYERSEEKQAFIPCFCGSSKCRKILR